MTSPRPAYARVGACALDSPIELNTPGTEGSARLAVSNNDQNIRNVAGGASLITEC